MANSGFLRATLAGGTALAAVFVASAALAQQQTSNATSSQSSQATGGIEEVVVTATKRAENVRAISGSVSAYTGADLEAMGAQSFEDYLTQTPGVVFNLANPGWSTVTIRGVSTTTGFDIGQGTTGYFINDVPLTDPFFAINVPDIDAFDVDNVTVLRGPQGTLFGSASLGGAIDYQAARPDLNEYQVHLQGTFEGSEGGGIGGAGKVMVNVPIIAGTLAIRAVYDYREDPGYIDNIGTGKKNSNSVLTRGGRFEATWQPTSKTTINYLFLRQTEDSPDGGYTIPPQAGPYGKYTTVPEPTAFGVTINNLRVDQDLGFATLTATGTYHQKTQYIVQDLYVYFGTPGNPLPGVLPDYQPQTGHANGETFEARLASPTDVALPFGGTFDYLIGGFFDNTHEVLDDLFIAPNAATVLNSTLPGFGFPPGTGTEITQDGGNVYEDDHNAEIGQEVAAFGELNYHPTPQWKLTFGGRYYDTQITNQTNDFGIEELFSSGAPTNIATGTERASGFLPKGSVTWTPDSDVMAYALISTGYRFGGVNPTTIGTTSTTPTSFGPDSLTNYEIGTRTTWLDQHLQLDGTIFYIDWKNIQVREFTALGGSYGTNAGAATNYGFEGTTTYAVNSDLTLQANLTYLSATLSEASAPGGFPAGTVLPGAAKWNIASSITYRWRDLPFEPTFRLSQRYISTAPAQLGPGTVQDGYDIVDASVAFDVSDNILVSAFVKNIGDARGVTQAYAGPPYLNQYLIPRRIYGVTFDYKM